MSHYKRDNQKIQAIMDDIETAKKGVRSLLDFAAHRLALRFAKNVIKITTPLEGGTTRSWADQIYRASTSIAANVAEGVGRGTPGMLVQFLRIARGSAFETLNWLQLCPAEVESERGGLVKDCLDVILAVEDAIVQASNENAEKYGGFTQDEREQLEQL